MLNRRPTIAALTLCLLLTTVSSLTRADAAADAKTAIQSAYNKQSAAFNKKDVKSVFAVYAADYVAIASRGSKNRTLAEMKLSMQMLFARGQNMNVKQTVQKMTVKGSQAIVLSKQHMQFSLIDPRTSTRHTTTSDANVEEIWVKTDKSGWLKKQTKVLSVVGTVDGKPAKR